MEAWEEAGLTREEYEEAMMEMEEALPSIRLSDNDLMAMHIDHVLKDVIPDGERNGFTTDMWDDVAHALEEGDILQHEEPTLANMDLVRSMADFAFAGGYDPKAYGAGSVHDWADRRGRAIAASEGREWPVRRDAGTNYEDMFAEDVPTSVHEVPFDEMVDYCIEHGEPWSRSLREELNRKVIRERDAIEQTAYEGAMREEEMRAVAGFIDDIRVREGLNGDEPDLSDYDARRLYYGKPSDEIIADAKELGEETGRNYVDDMRDLYARVFKYGNRDFSTVPDEVRSGLRTADFAIQPATYGQLGEDYAKFYKEALQSYALDKQRETAGVDFSKSAVRKDDGVGIPAPVREDEKSADKDREADAARRVVHDYTPRFSDGPQDGLSSELGED